MPNVPVLLYDPSESKLETSFWSRVAAVLRGQGFDLYIDGDYGAYPSEVPVVGSPTSLDAIGTSLSSVDAHSGLTAGLDIDMVLRREEAYFGAPPNGRNRRDAVYAGAMNYAQTLLALRPAVAIVWNGQFAKHLIVRRLLERCRVPVLFAERAPLPGFIYTDERGLMCDASFARTPLGWTSSDEASEWARVFRDYELRTASSASTWHDQPPTRPRGGNLRSAYQIPDEATVVLFPEQLDGDTQTLLFSPRFARSADALGHLITLLRPYRNFVVIAKPHPMSKTPSAEYERILDGVGRWIPDIAIGDALECSDYVCGVNSSVLFEAMCRRKPVLAFGRTILEGRGIFYEPQIGRDAAAVQMWLERKDWHARVGRWNETCAWLLRHHFFNIERDPEGRLSGEEEISRRVIARAKASHPDYSVLLTEVSRHRQGPADYPR